MKNKKNENKKNAVIIGASGNLGRALCKTLEAQGYWIEPKWRKENHPDSTLASSFDDLPPKIHLAAYLAGVNKISSIEEMKEEDWDKVLNVNLKGAFLFAKAAFPALKAAEGAVFVVISSIMITHPYPGRIAYASAKAGLEGLTRTLAVEWGKYSISAHAIRLGHLKGLMKSTVVDPGLLDSVKSKTPSGKLIDPMDVASYIAWLGTESGRTISGTVIDFDPAYTINRWPLNQ